MKAVSAKAKKVLDVMVASLTEDGKVATFGKEGGAVMPATVSRVIENIFRVGQYFEQNGDEVADCELVVVRGGDGNYYPFEYRQDTLGIRQVVATDVQSSGSHTPVNPRQQAQITSFASKWIPGLPR